MSSLEAYLDQLLAAELQVPAEAITPMFIHEMRKKMETDPEFRQAIFQDNQTWLQKCRTYAQEVLRNGPTPCN